MKSSWRRPLIIITPLKLLWVLALSAGILLGVLWWHQRLLLNLSRLLVHEDQPVPTEAILLLGGDVTSRVDYAAEIHPFVRPELILVTPHRRAGEDVARLIHRHGFSSAEIYVLPASSRAQSTVEEVLAFQRFLAARPVQSVTIVTAAFHTGRAYWVFRRLLDERIQIRMGAAPHETFDTTGWWRSEDGLVTVVNELSKWLFYWGKYGPIGNRPAGTHRPLQPERIQNPFTAHLATNIRSVPASSSDGQR